MMLAWHTNIAPRWLDLQQHDGGATPDNFLNVLHDALIKNSRDELYDHVALAERYEFAEDARSATLWLRPGTSSSTMMPRSHRTTSNATTAPGPQCRRQHRWCGDARPPHLPLLPFLDPALKEFLIGATSRQFGLSATRSRRSGRRSVQRADILLSGPYRAGAADIRCADQPWKIGSAFGDRNRPARCPGRGCASR